MFSKILVPIDVDYPETASAVVRKATALAKLCGAQLRLASVMPGFGMPIVSSYITDDIRRETAQRMQESMEQFIASYFDQPVDYSLATGKNWHEVVKIADQWGADLIVVYYNYHCEFNELFSDSCTRKIVEHAECSVLKLRNIFDNPGEAEGMV
jgi:nucleotide-binding universal stress UspA family protein